MWKMCGCVQGRMFKVRKVKENRRKVRLFGFNRHNNKINSASRGILHIDKGIADAANDAGD